VPAWLEAQTGIAWLTLMLHCGRWRISERHSQLGMISEVGLDSLPRGSLVPKWVKKQD